MCNYDIYSTCLRGCVMRGMFFCYWCDSYEPLTIAPAHETLCFLLLRVCVLYYNFNSDLVVTYVYRNSLLQESS